MKLINFINQIGSLLNLGFTN